MAEGPTSTYLYEEGLFELRNSEGVITHTLTLKEALQLTGAVGHILCGNALIIERNLRYALKPVFKRTTNNGHYDYEAIRHVIQDINRPFHRVK